MKGQCNASEGQGLRCHHSVTQCIGEPQVQGERRQIGSLPHCPIRVLQGRKSGLLCTQKHCLPLSTVQARAHRRR